MISFEQKKKLTALLSRMGAMSESESSVIGSLFDELEKIRNMIPEKADLAPIESDMARLKESVFSASKTFSEIFESVRSEIRKASANGDSVGESLKKIESEFHDAVMSVSDELSDAKREISLRISQISKNRGGGSMNRQELVNGTDPLTRYSDINWKAGSNISIVPVSNDATKKVDITINSTASGGSSALPLNAIQLGDGAGGFKTLGGTVLDATGNARGAGALEFQACRSDATQVASGQGSAAFGSLNTASGYCSNAIGYANNAAENYSSAFGYGNTADSGCGCGGMSSAFGYSNVASGQGSAAFGSLNTASGADSFAFGGGLSNVTSCSAELGANDGDKIRVSSAGLNLNTSSGYFMYNSSVFPAVDGSTITGNGTPSDPLVSHSCGCGSSLTLETNGCCNSSQAILNLVACCNMSINESSGSVFFCAIPAPLLFKTNDACNGSQCLLNLVQGSNMSITEDGSGNVTFCSSASGCGGGSPAGPEGSVQIYRSGSFGSLPGAILDEQAGFAGTCALDLQSWRTSSGYVAGGNCSLAVGNSNTASSGYSSAVGSRNTSNSGYASSVGTHNTASGYCSSAFGAFNIVSGSGSGAFGFRNSISSCSSYAFAFGFGITNSVCSSAEFGFGDTNKLQFCSGCANLTGCAYGIQGSGGASFGFTDGGGGSHCSCGGILVF